MEHQMVNIAYKDVEGWDCIETCYVGERRFWFLLSIGGEVVSL